MYAKMMGSMIEAPLRKFLRRYTQCASYKYRKCDVFDCMAAYCCVKANVLSLISKLIDSEKYAIVVLAAFLLVAGELRDTDLRYTSHSLVLSL